MKTYDVTIQFSGKMHSGKTSVLALVAEHLKSLGIEVTVQRADPQIDTKLENLDSALERAKKCTVHLTEFNTAY